MLKAAAILLCGALGWSPVQGQDTPPKPVAALISELSGDASIEASPRRPARRFDTIAAGQTVRTGPNARCVLVLMSGQRFELGPGARATIAGDRLTPTSGPITELPSLPTLPRIAALDASRPQGPPGAVRLRASRVSGLRPYHAVIATQPLTLRFQPVEGASRYTVEIEDETGRSIFRGEVVGVDLAVPAGTLVPGATYYWSVESLDKAGGAARGTSRFTTLSTEAAERRDTLRRALASDAGPAAIALQAEVDRRLMLYPEALEAFRIALARSPDDPAIQRALRWLEDLERLFQR
ncbi:MAG: hypothetical protein ABIX28_23450 [Vicinamibacterales bacterium]